MTDRYQRELSRGVLVNTIGLVAKLVHPLYFVVVTWLFGTDLVGLFFVAFFIGEFAISAASSGYNEATTIFGSGAREIGDDGELYQVFANGLWAALLLGGTTVVMAYAGSQWLIDTVYPDRPQLAPALRILSWSIPLVALSHVWLAATKALLKMEYNVVIDGFARPLLLLAFTIVAWWGGGGLKSLMWAFLASNAVVAALALWAFTRHFSLPTLAAEMARLRIHRPMLGFAVPQSLNMTFNRFLTRIDALMLAAFGFSNHLVAFYSAAALLTSNLREVRLIFSTALSPVMARHHARGDREALQHDISRVSRWTTTLVVPLLLVLLVFRRDILLLIDNGFTGDTRFMVVLLVAPFVNCALGLAGNAIVSTHHSVWNLLNSFLVSGLNAALNYTLIPIYGLMGAAIATSTSAVAVAVFAVIELYFLERVTILWRQVFKPYVALAAASGVAWLLWDPAMASPGGKIVAALAMLSVFIVTLVVLRHEELTAFLRRRFSR